ncbi:hypothetical protein Goshw_010311 [Gossypium schwendimanii]|uniref:Uncharacterized protein n=1 Tax=Gossypium schwendimanii TaxID=34291 RepID=A0A7J9L2E4_GOSSC|nr:hypothetical protein [Gossypium schwendimanii]
MGKPGLLDLENHFAFYGENHILDKKAGSLAALLCLACWVGASFITAKLGYSLAWKVNFCSFVVKYQP